MQTRNKAKLAESSADFQNFLETLHEPRDGGTCGSGQPQNTTLSDASRKDVDKLLERVGERRALVKKNQENSSHYLGRKKQKSAIQGENPLFYQRRSSETKFHTLPSCGVVAKTKLDSEPTAKGNDENHTKHAAAKRHENQEAITELDEYIDDKEFDWEEGNCMSCVGIVQSHPTQWSGEVTIEVEDEDTYNQGRKQSVRRATARDKEFAELVHKVHLLCLIGRGMLIDNACNDPLIQACLYSLIPSKLLNLGKEQKLTANVLKPFVEWFQNAFHIRSPEEGSSDPDDRVTVVTKLCHAIERRGGTNEEVAALSVAVLRVLGLTTRYVSVLDVTTLKPDAESLEASADWNSDSDSENGGSLLHMNATKTTIASLGQVLARCPSQGSTQNMTFKDQGPGLIKRGRYNKRGSDDRNSVPDKITAETTVPQLQPAVGGKETVTQNENSEVIDRKDKGKLVKRKGDLEFEMQLAMALAATAAEAPGDTKSDSIVALNGLDKSAYSDMSASTSKRHQNKRPRFLAQEKHPAVWSRKQAPSLHWAEVYCEGETLTGRWVHVDAANGVIDGEHKVTEAVCSCRRPLRYVLAFAGNGAKDVTHRYVTQWSAIVPQRVSSPWWKSTLVPLKELEAAATAEISNVEMSKEDALHSSACDNLSQSHACGSSGGKANVLNRSSLEDMELETRIFTEPLPTNQQAYKNHHLYVLERWLTKYQTLHPKGPVLGYCAGQPVYPRTCVQILHTAERWLREGLQIKKGEAPVKILKPSQNRTRGCPSEPQYLEEDCFQGHAVELFGKWQTEPLQLPPAMDGIVPKNERGHVDMWSEKCLPPGTVHLRLPRLVPIAKKLGIDFAPAMVGFEIHNGRSVPIFEGIVVCKEFREAILQAYSEEEGRRAIEEKRRNEHQALSRWNQLLRSIATRQRLQSDYGETYSNAGQLSVISTNENMRCVAGTNTHAAKNAKMTRDDTVQDSGVHEHIRSLEKPNDDLTNIEENFGKHKTIPAHNHIHVYPEENRSYDEENDMWTKRCPCGFSIQVEEM